jgi:3-deoxy-D-manno-octulosonate 8-phosphate phosphatase (KDO 8-P phosphatase)
MIDLRAIKLLVFDFDGVWTNNQVLVMEDGTEGVLANRSDGLGIGMLRDSGLVQIAVLTAEVNPAPQRRCEKLRIPCVVAKNKLPMLEQMIAERKLSPSQVCFVGNDVNDIPCMRHVALGVAVADAHPKCLAAAGRVTQRAGGFGAVREVVDWFLDAHGVA